MTSFAALTAGLAAPILAAPLFIASTSELVIAQCRAGIIGSFPALNARGSDQALHDWLSRIEDGLEQQACTPPFAVNQIVHRTNARLSADVETCVRHRVPIVITSLGAQREVNDAVHSYGGLVLHDVTNQVHAHKAIEKAQTADPRGPRGRRPRGHTVAVRADGGNAGLVEGPVALAGAIATGRGIMAARALGADLAYVGSLFSRARRRTRNLLTSRW